MRQVGGEQRERERRFPVGVVHRVRGHVYRMARSYDIGVRQVHALNLHSLTRHQPMTRRDLFSWPEPGRRPRVRGHCQRALSEGTVRDTEIASLAAWLGLEERGA